MNHFSFVLLQGLLLLGPTFFLIHTPDVLACGGGGKTGIESWRRSSTGSGFDVIVKHDVSQGQKRYLIRGGEGAFFMLTNLYASENTEYEEVATAAGLSYSYSEGCKVTGTSEDEITISSSKAALFKEALQTAIQFLNGKAAEFGGDAALTAKYQAVLDDFKNAKGSPSFDAKEWCEFGALLGSPLLVGGGMSWSLDAFELKKGESYDASGTSAQKVELGRKRNPGEHSEIDIEDTYDALLLNLPFPPSKKPLSRGCNPEFGDMPMAAAQ